VENKEAIQEATIDTPVAQAEEVVQRPISNAEHNLSSMRRKLEAEEAARKLAENRAQELERAMQSYQQPQSQQPIEESDDIGVDNEDYVQAKHVKTSNKKMSKKLSVAEQKLMELEQRLSYMQAKVDTSSLKDFDEVVSDDNLKTLARLYPDDYETLRTNPNASAKAKTAYNMIKNYGILDAHKSTTRNMDIENRIIQNKQKPQSSSNVSPQQPQTPLTRLDDYERRVLTEADRDRIMAEVARKKSTW
jgi:hypothetical protein